MRAFALTIGLKKTVDQPLKQVFFQNMVFKCIIKFMFKR